ncbi:phosphoribosyltransferase family protein, partial [Sinorhizobium sp. 6-117]|uniref:ComF family protein n=1 Tax=Sinorhizobium sp. 6-117 TaxID=3049090 RepID=UPI0024C41650
AGALDAGREGFRRQPQAHLCRLRQGDRLDGPDVLRRIKRTSRQVGLGARAREENVRGAFVVPESGRPGLSGKRIILVDDVYTTGATVSAATRALKRAGAGDVTVLTFARAMSGPI